MKGKNVGLLDSLSDVGKVTLEIGNSKLIVEHVMDRGSSVIFIIHTCSVGPRDQNLRICIIEVGYDQMNNSSDANFI